jgi:hypothetical protein
LPSIWPRPHPALIWLAGVAILVLRQPDALLHANFWGEDGWNWFPEAYAAGWHSLAWPHTGYLQTAPRLVALATQPFPLAWGPTLFAAVAIAAQALPGAFLLARRMDAVWPSVPGRMLFALLYAALPNSFEVSANLTNTQWHLAVLAFLVVASAPARGLGGRSFDSGVLLLSGLSGPFCVFLLPVAVWCWVRDRIGQRLRRLILLAGCCAVQGACLLATMDATRSTAPLGATAIRLARIVAAQIVLGPLLGTRIGRIVADGPVWAHNAVPTLVALAGLALAAAALWCGPALLRMAVLAAGLLFAAALAHPQVNLTEPQWQIMTEPGLGQRYYFVPMLAWIGVLLTLVCAPQRVFRIPAIALLLLSVAGISGDWRPPTMAATDFVAKARDFADAPAGTRMEFPLHPPGAYPMVLVKAP